MEFVAYNEQSTFWPASAENPTEEIFGQYDDEGIWVYQAYNHGIGKAVVEQQSFLHPAVARAGYSTTRMTWIKPGFLWMMFRSGWGSKENQECILAIKVRRASFDGIVTEGVRSNVLNGNKPDVVIQWDPDHAPDGSKVLSRRAIQIGLRGRRLMEFLSSDILQIVDLTDFVQSNKDKALDDLIVPKERIYSI